MKKKGFTLVELLVVIAIIALLMGILMPALARVRQIAYRLYCGTNLSGIGKAMLIYCNDYDDEMPQAACVQNQNKWVMPLPGNGWAQGTEAQAFAAGASISSHFYMLVKFAEVTPKSFLCKGDPGVVLFEPADYSQGGRDLVTLYDFGGTNTLKHCSYAYHQPFPTAATGGTGYQLTSSSDPGMAVAADPNPWQSGYERAGKDTTLFKPINGTKAQINAGNAGVHQDEGQNVLFVDGHTSFEKEPMCGVDSDNIYTSWGTTTPSEQVRKAGAFPHTAGDSFPSVRNDNLLLTDGIGPTGGR